MRLVRHRPDLAAALLLLSCTLLDAISASAITSPPKPTSAPISNGTCEFRTINYITDTLPQLCLRSSWSQSNGTLKLASEAANTTATGDTQTAESSPMSSSLSGESTSQIAATTEAGSADPKATVVTTTITPSENLAAPASDLDTGELNEDAFLSFEEWKKQTLAKAGQANANIGNRRSGENKKRDSESFQNDLDSLGEEGEIDLDFGGFGSRGSGADATDKPENGRSEVKETKNAGGSGKRRDHYRSKDAGKTCKERFSYASFDAGATILKSHPGAKHAKAVLIENKDSYMLSECSTPNKFIIIELSEDIWIDTLVLANYEFFSSMIRTFRVSVSDRYPVKLEKWKDAGTYEARNSRDIQAFLIENPQIWARYLRIEFLSHYGNEYYCPLSLVRVHGTRMLESWRESEGGDEENESIESGSAEEFIPEAVAEVVKQEERQNAQEEANKSAEAAAQEQAEAAPSIPPLTDFNSSENTTSRWSKPEVTILSLFHRSHPEAVCLPAEAPSQPTHATTIPNSGGSQPVSNTDSAANPTPVSQSTTVTASPPQSVQSNKPGDSSATVQVSTQPSSQTANSSSSVVSVSSTSITASSTTPSAVTKSQNSTASPKGKSTNTTSASTSLPTIQESFFKAVSRRLQLLESNSTLSLQYIEEQSRALREAFTKIEKRQLQKTNIFLDVLNSTVLDELRGFRQQYDEIWQSTVISLESQREESRREILAISSRLNILADEVIFQKRMSIVQSVLLLLCLGLVIFSRVAGGSIDFPRLHHRPRHFSGFQVESPIDSSPDSPQYHPPNSLREGRRCLNPERQRQHSEETTGSRSRSRDVSPPTPISSYSRSADPSLSPPLGTNDTTISGDGTTEYLDVPMDANSPPHTTKKRKRRSQQNQSPQASHSDNSFDPKVASDPNSHHSPTKRNGEHYGSSRSILPSPPPEDIHGGRANFSTARKPLPALPVDGG